MLRLQLPSVPGCWAHPLQLLPSPSSVQPPRCLLPSPALGEHVQAFWVPVMTSLQSGTLQTGCGLTSSRFSRQQSAIPFIPLLHEEGAHRPALVTAAKAGIPEDRLARKQMFWHEAGPPSFS